MKTSPVKIGVIGCGNISDAYFNGCKTFPMLEIVHCADLDLSRAAAKAVEGYATILLALQEAR